MVGAGVDVTGEGMPFVATSAAPLEPHPDAAHPAFDRAAAGGLTLFTAPPGYLLAEALHAALQRHGRDVTWVRLEPTDGDPGALLSSVVAAVRQRRPGFGPRPWSACQASPARSPAGRPCSRGSARSWPARPAGAARWCWSTPTTSPRPPGP
jgi:hypothetical protein